MKKKLLWWNSRLLLLGGKVVLINFVLNNLPLFYLSFYKAPKMVIHEINLIPRIFLGDDNLYKKEQQTYK